MFVKKPECNPFRDLRRRTRLNQSGKSKTMSELARGIPTQIDSLDLWFERKPLFPGQRKSSLIQINIIACSKRDLLREFVN
jgi:hypothetical protein